MARPAVCLRQTEAGYPERLDPSSLDLPSGPAVAECRGTMNLQRPNFSHDGHDPLSGRSAIGRGDVGIPRDIEPIDRLLASAMQAPAAPVGLNERVFAASRGLLPRAVVARLDRSSLR